MNRTVYVNGEFLPEEKATISVFDRGFLFADAVYEVSSVLEGKLIDNQAHLERLNRSLGELQIRLDKTSEEIESIQKQIIEKNGLREGLVYLQASRGAADRDFPFPEKAKPSFVMFPQEKNLLSNPAAEKGISIVSAPDIRWKRRDIKTVQLLAPSLAKQEALRKGADDAWMIENGYVTEGTSNNAWIVRDGEILTRAPSSDILRGITRQAILRLAKQTGIRFVERSFTLDEAIGADEAFITSASNFVVPVVKIDGKPIGNGKPGEVAVNLRKLYIEEAMRAAS